MLPHSFKTRAALAALAVLLFTASELQAQTTCRIEKRNTAGIQAAIDACAARGGGVVSLPSGLTVSGPLWMKTNVEFHLEAGATLRMSRKPEDWQKEVRALINSDGAHHFAISGTGTIDGAATWAYEPVKRVDIEIAAEQALAEKAGVEMKRFYRTGEVQKYLLVLQKSSDVRIEDVTITNAPLWNVRLQDCDRVWIRGVSVLSDLEKGVNSDGIDIVSSSNVTISDSTIITGDDAICLKTDGMGREHKGPVRPTENILVTNSILGSSSTPLMIGTETYADIRHVVFSNIVIRNSNKVFGINVQDGGTVSDVRVSNITFETQRRHWNWWGDAEFIKIVLKKRSPESKLGRIEHITIDGAQGIARGTSLVAGHTERDLEDIRITNVALRLVPEGTPDQRTSHGLVFERIDGLVLRNVDIDWDTTAPQPTWQSALVLRDIDGLQMTEVFTSGTRKGVPAVVKQRVRNKNRQP
jgi:Glycosyl hydrolases family 28